MNSLPEAIIIYIYIYVCIEMVSREYFAIFFSVHEIKFLSFFFMCKNYKEVYVYLDDLKVILLLYNNKWKKKKKGIGRCKKQSIVR